MSEPTHPTRDTLSLLLRAELEAPEHEDVARHLRTCTACTRALREEAALDLALLQAHAPEDVPDRALLQAHAAEDVPDRALPQSRAPEGAPDRALLQAHAPEAALDLTPLQAHATEASLNDLPREANAPLGGRNGARPQLQATAEQPDGAQRIAAGTVTPRNEAHVHEEASQSRRERETETAAAPSMRAATRRRRTRRTLWAAGAALAAGIAAWLLSAPLRTREDTPATPATAGTAELCLARPDDAACQAAQGAPTPAATESPAETAPSNFGAEVR